MRYKLAPSILSADFARLGEEVGAIAPFSDIVHVDVMDGHFVPPITIGPVVVEALRRVTDLPLECHLMVTEPENQIEQFAEAGGSSVVWHLEASGASPVPILERARSLGLGAGLAINPRTGFDDVAPHCESIDTLICMTVNPGWAGQKFLAEVLPKIEQAREFFQRHGLGADLAVDGGVDLRTGRRALDAGANVLGAASAIFKAPDPPGAAKALRSLLEEFGAIPGSA
ncbi:MAG: ribulose-phosphate 3-epimerase [Actinomycetota bacterium]